MPEHSRACVEVVEVVREQHAAVAVNVEGVVELAVHDCVHTSYKQHPQATALSL